MLTQTSTRPLQVETTLEKNLAALGATSPQTARMILEAEPAPGIEFIETSDEGALSATLDGRQLASRRKPLQEAERLASTIDIKAHGGIVALGFGLGHHVAAAAKKMRHDGVIIIFEPDVALMRAVLERIDHSDWIRESNVIVLTDAEDTGAMSAATRGAEAVLALGVHILEHVPSRARLAGQASKFASTFGDIVAAVRTVVVTAMVQMDVTYRNFFMNLDHYAMGDGIAELKDLYKGRPAILVSAGPSLRRNIDALRDPHVRERFVIVAVQTALKPLLAAGVKPHFVTALDYHEISKRFYEGLTAADLEGVTLVAEPEANPAILDAFQGDVRVCSEAMLDEVVGEELAFVHGDLERGATVAHLAYYLARYVGCDPVVLVGQDLGFPDHVYYGRGAAIHETWAPELNAFNTLEMMELERVLRGRSSLRPAKDQRGRSIYTDEQMWTYLTQFERDFLRDSDAGMTIVDATEGGVSKRHTQSMTLAEAIEQFGSTDHDAIVPPSKAQSRRSEQTHDALRKRLQTLREDVVSIATLSGKAHRELGRMLHCHDDQARVNRLIDRVHKLNAEVRSKDLAFRVVNRLNQTGGFKRARSDRSMRLDEGLTGLELQKAQIERDQVNVKWIGDAAEEFAELLEASIAALDGAPKRTRDPLPQDPDEHDRAAKKARVEAVVPIDAERLDEEDFAETLLQTLNRLAACSELDGVTLLTTDIERTREVLDGAAADVHLAAMDAKQWRERMDGVRPARLFGADGWRGGLCSTTSYDEALAPEATLELVRERGLAGAFVVGAEWSHVDPELCDRVVARFRERPEGSRLVFSQASPGLAGCVMERALLEEIVGTERGVGGFRSIGGVLGYVPVRPRRDPIADATCVQIDADVRSLTSRLIADSPSRRAGLNEDDTDVRSLAERVALADAQQGPAHLVLELCTERATSPAPGLLPTAGGAGRTMDASLTKDILGAFGASRPDGLVTFAGAGDPLLHAELESLVCAARQSGALGIHVRTDLASDAHVEALLRAAPDVISVNIMAATAETYSALMGDGDFDALHARLDRLRAGVERADGLPQTWIVPRIARCDATHDEIERFYDRWKLIFGAAMVEQVFDDTQIDAPESLGKPASVARRDWRQRMFILADGHVVSDEWDLAPKAPFDRIASGDELIGVWRRLLEHRERIAREQGVEHPDLRTGW